MKILQINASDSPIGGASRLAFDLFTCLKKRHSSKMVVGLKTQDDKNIKQLKKTLFQKIKSLLFANDIDYFNTEQILNFNEFTEADIINCHNLHGWYFNLGALEKMCKLKPVVWTLHDMWAVTPRCAHSYSDDITDGFYNCRSLNDYPSTLWDNDSYLCNRKNHIYKNADFAIVVPSMWLLNKINKSVLKDREIKLIYNGIDTSLYTRTDKRAAREELKLPLNKKIYLYVANNCLENKFKGGQYISDLIKEYADRDDIIFLCVGADKDDEYSNVIIRKKISDKNKMAKYMSASDIFIFPSLAENFPLIILEAMSCGLPIVSFNVGGVAEAVTHMVNGYITGSNNTAELRKGIEYINSLSSEETTKMSQKSILDVKDRFSIEKMTEEYEKFYAKLIKDKNEKNN